MERLVYLGPYNSSKSDELFNRAVEYLKENKGHKFYYILPNGNLLVKYRQKFIDKVEHTFDINLFTFDNIVDKLLQDSYYVSIDDETKEGLLAKIVEELREKGLIPYYEEISHKRGFIRAVSSIIGQLKRSLISPEKYLAKCPKAAFFKEIGFIYKEYEKKLGELKVLDREEGYIKSLEFLRQDNSFFDGLDFVVIDYFFEFRPQEIELLKELTKVNCSIYVNMPFNRAENFSTFNRTLALLKEMGFSIVKEEEGRKDYFTELANLLFTEGEEKLAHNSNIHLIKASSTYLEIKKICEEIKRVHSKGVKLEDMAIVLASPDRYKDRLFQVFEEEGIPLALSKETSLIELPLIKEFVQLLEVKKNQMDKSSIINRIKSNFFPLCSRDMREAIEYILRKEDINSPLKAEIDRLLALIEEENNSIPAKGRPEELVNSLMTFIREYNVPGRIVDIYNSIGDYNLLNRDFTALSKLKEILGKIEKFASIIYEEISFEAFLALLESYLEKETIVEIEGNMAGISVLTPAIVRGQRFKVLFVMGLSQGDYPAIGSDNFFFQEKNIKALKDIGVDVKNYYEVLDKEALIFSIIISSCLEKLYLSYSQASTEDEEAIPSMFLDELLNRLQGKVDKKTVNMDYLIKDDLTNITTKEELARYILNRYQEGQCEEELFHMYNHLDSNKLKEINQIITCEIERNRADFNEYKGLIGDEEIKKDMEKLHKDKVYSISYLEAYGKCPYYFLMNNILQVDKMERELEAFTPLDRGAINHEVLEEYYTTFRKQIEDHILGKGEFDPDKTYDFILARVKEKMEAIAGNVSSPVWKLRLENNAENLLEFIKKDLERLTKAKEKVLPYAFEVTFGKNEAFVIEVGEKEISFTGIIDRLDKYVDEDKYILIDYKNSSGGVKDISQMEAGLSLQMPLYIMSQQDKNIVAALYGVISSKEFKAALGKRKETSFISARNKGALYEEELKELFSITKEHIKSYIASILAGDFSIKPKECSNYCIYKDICRYKDTLEVEV